MINLNGSEDYLNCVCKGIRVCIKCEETKIKSNVVKKKEADRIIDLTEYISVRNNEGYSEFYIELDKVGDDNKEALTKYLNEQFETINKEISFEVNNVKFNTENIFEGFFLVKNFIKSRESEEIVNEVNSHDWVSSQSGRKKQDYGPKINYKKRKVKFNHEGNFPGYYDKYISNKIDSLEFLKYFKTAEIGNLWYSPENGSCIDPHIDHYWIWGRIVGINFLTECVMTFSNEINIPLVDKPDYTILFEINLQIGINDAYAMTGSSRYVWKHSIKRENIFSERVVMTLREYENSFIRRETNFNILKKSNIEKN